MTGGIQAPGRGRLDPQEWTHLCVALWSVGSGAKHPSAWFCAGHGLCSCVPLDQAWHVVAQGVALNMHWPPPATGFVTAWGLLSPGRPVRDSGSQIVMRMGPVATSACHVDQSPGPRSTAGVRVGPESTLHHEGRLGTFPPKLQL